MHGEFEPLRLMHTQSPKATSHMHMEASVDCLHVYCMHVFARSHNHLILYSQ